MPRRPDTSAAKILGGAFGLEVPANVAGAVPLFGAEAQYFLSVRCALYALCEIHRPGTAWLPSYLCGSLLEPFAKSGIPIRYYEVDERLSVAETAWIREICDGDLVLVIHYFGFANATFPVDRIASRGALIVEDASQALCLGKQFPASRCILYSLRKFLGVPDGAVVVPDRALDLESPALGEPPQSWWRSAVTMTMKRREFDLTGEPNDWYALFRRVEAEYPVGLYRASELSRMLIASADTDAIRIRRCENYSRLLERIGRFALFPKLDPGVVPMGFPACVDPAIRDQVLRKLHSTRVYAPAHWPLAGVVPDSFASSHRLARSCLTLICDQRYTLDDMDRQAQVFERALQ